MREWMTPRRRARATAGLALALPVLALCLPFLTSSRCLYGFDFDACYRPQAVFIREAFAQSGRLPLWNPRQFAGTPSLGNPNFGLYYPPEWLFLALAPENAYEILVFLHLLLAAWGMYRLARFFRLSRASSVLASIAFGISMSASAKIWAGLMTHLFAQSLAPALLWLTARAIRKPGAMSLALLATAVSLLLLAGHPQFIGHLGLLAAALTIWRLADRARRGEEWIRTAFSVVGAAALGIAIAAVHVWPSLEVAGDSTRGVGEGLHDGAFPAQESLTPADLVYFVQPCPGWTDGAAEIAAPDLTWHEKVAYVGILPLLLVPLAWSSRRRGPVLFFAIAAFVMLLDAEARDLPVHAALSGLPIYGVFRYPVRSLWIVTLSLSLLAGFGWESVRSGEIGLARRSWTAGIAGAILFFIAAFFGFGRQFRLEIHIMAGLGVAAFGMILAGRSVPAVVLAALDLLVIGWAVQHKIPRENYRVPPWYARVIGPERAEYRILDLTTFFDPPIAHGFRMMDAYSYPILRSTERLYRKAWSDYPGPTAVSLSHGTRLADPGVLRKLNVRWIVSGDPPLTSSWKEIARERQQVLYEDRTARPFAFLENAPGSATWTRPTSDCIEVNCRAERPARLVVSEAFTPAWRALRDGVPVPIDAVEGALLGVDLPAGPSRILFVYDPPSYRHGKALTVVGLLAVAALAIFGWRRRA